MGIPATDGDHYTVQDYVRDTYRVATQADLQLHTLRSRLYALTLAQDEDVRLRVKLVRGQLESGETPPDFISADAFREKYLP